MASFTNRTSACPPKITWQQSVSSESYLSNAWSMIGMERVKRELYPWVGKGIGQSCNQWGPSYPKWKGRHPCHNRSKTIPNHYGHGKDLDGNWLPSVCLYHRLRAKLEADQAIKGSLLSQQWSMAEHGVGISLRHVFAINFLKWPGWKLVFIFLRTLSQVISFFWTRALLGLLISSFSGVSSSWDKYPWRSQGRKFSTK